MSKAKKLKRRQAEAEKAAHKAKLKKIRKVTAVITASVLLAVMIISAILFGAYNKRMNDGEYLRESIAAASKHFEVDGAMMTYFFNDTYNTFISYYGSYVQYFGIDTQSSLKDQTYTDGESWFDYFMGGSRTTVERILALSEAGVDFGGSIKNDAQMLAIYNRVQRMDEGLYGRGVNKQDIFNAKILEANAYFCQFIKESEFEPTAEEVLLRYESDPKVYLLASYYAFPIYYSEGSDGSKLPSKEDAEKTAAKLAAALTEDDFRTAACEILLSEDAKLTEADASKKLDEMELTAQFYSESSEVSKWAFGDNADITYTQADEENATITVYFLTKAPYRDDTLTVSARHILLSNSAYGSREGALEAANAVLEKFNAGEKNTDSFALLALEYSDDAGSYYRGGLYDSMHKGQMVTEFDAWCFDEGRKQGDIGIVETAYGCHIMYFEGVSHARWEADVRYDIVNERFDAYLTEITEAYPVLFDENVIDMIPG